MFDGSSGRNLSSQVIAGKRKAKTDGSDIRSISVGYVKVIEEKSTVANQGFEPDAKARSFTKSLQRLLMLAATIRTTRLAHLIEIREGKGDVLEDEDLAKIKDLKDQLNRLLMI